MPSFLSEGHLRRDAGAAHDFLSDLFRSHSFPPADDLVLLVFFDDFVVDFLATFCIVAFSELFLVVFTGAGSGVSGTGMS